MTAIHRNLNTKLIFPSACKRTVAGSSLFSNSFRSALKESLERQQTEMDVKYGYGSDDEYIATPYKSAGPARR